MRDDNLEVDFEGENIPLENLDSESVQDEPFSEKEKLDDVVSIDEHKRLLADFINYRKRSALELSDSVKRGENGLFYSLLPLFDFMDLFLANNNPSDNNFKFLFNELNSLKSKYGLVRIGEEGEPFNPDIHSALESEDGAGIISKIYSYGYARDGVILRVAMVGVK